MNPLQTLYSFFRVIAKLFCQELAFSVVLLILRFCKVVAASRKVYPLALLLQEKQLHRADVFVPGDVLAFDQIIVIIPHGKFFIFQGHLEHEVCIFFPEGKESCKSAGVRQNTAILPGETYKGTAHCCGIS